MFYAVIEEKALNITNLKFLKYESAQNFFIFIITFILTVIG